VLPVIKKTKRVGEAISSAKKRILSVTKKLAGCRAEEQRPMTKALEKNGLGKQQRKVSPTAGRGASKGGKKRNGRTPQKGTGEVRRAKREIR